MMVTVIVRYHVSGDELQKSVKICPQVNILLLTHLPWTTKVTLDLQ